jgi:transcriptional regulator with XRE-family HTH domain
MSEPIDAYVAARLGWARRARSLSIEALARKGGVDPDSLRGFESGRHVPAETLLRFATALEVPVRYFFDETPGSLAHSTDKLDELVAAFVRIGTPEDRARVIELARSLARANSSFAPCG